MIRFMKYATSALLAVSAAMLGGCSADPEPTTDGEVILRLLVETGFEKASRAQDPNYFEGANGNFEKISSLRVIIVNGVASGNPLGEVEANRVVDTDEEGHPINDKMEFKVKSGRKRIYLIANEASLPAPTIRNEEGFEERPFETATQFLNSFRDGFDFDARIFTQWTVELPGSQPNATTNLYSNIRDLDGRPIYLPLTEYFDIVVEALKSDGVAKNAGSRADETEATTVTDIETQYVHLFLTRAAAKATYHVTVAPDYTGIMGNITGIRLSGLNWAQYVFPRSTTYSPAKEAKISFDIPIQAGVATDRYITSFATPERVNDVTGASLAMQLTGGRSIPLSTSTDATTLPMYFPESLFPLSASASDQFTVSVQISDGNWLTAKPLEDNILQVTKPMDDNPSQTYTRNAIARNTHLLININFTGQEITWRAVEAPYNSVSLNPEFGFNDK